MSKEVAKKEEGVLVAADQLAELSGMGFEEMGATDVAIPFITILQDLSPQVKKGPRQIEGAESGMLYNNVTGKIYNPDRGLVVIPCGYQKRQVEWKPRESGGGFVKQHNDPALLETCKRDDKGKFVLPNGNFLVETGYHFCLMADPETGDLEHVVIGMSSSNLGPSRKWNYSMRKQKIKRSDGSVVPAPMFAYSYSLTTTMQEKNNNTYFVFNVETEGPVEDQATLRVAYDFCKSISTGAAQVAGEENKDDEIPF